MVYEWWMLTDLLWQLIRTFDSQSLVLFGGQSFDTEASPPVYFNDVWELDPTGDWTVVLVGASWSPRYDRSAQRSHFQCPTVSFSCNCVLYPFCRKLTTALCRRRGGRIRAHTRFHGCCCCAHEAFVWCDSL